ncbi:unnamed protein product, partial [marine sediment metagenome]
MNMIPEDSINAVYPNFMEGFRRAQSIMNSIACFEDVERHLMKGRGLVASTYVTHRVAVRKLYEYIDVNLFQVTPNHIEDFYDSLMKEVSRNTAYGRIQGLKWFYNGLRSLFPGHISPFEIMDEELVKKLNKLQKPAITKAMPKGEAVALLNDLRSRKNG